MSKRAAKRQEAAARLQLFSLFLLGVVLVLSIVRRDTTVDVHPKMMLVGMVGGSFFLLATSVFLCGRWPVAMRTTDPAIIGFTLLAIASITWAQDMRSAVVRAAEIAAVGVVFLLTRITARSAVRQRALIGVLLATAAVAILYGYYQYSIEFDELLEMVRRHPESLEELDRVNAALGPDLISRLESREVYSFFAISNVFAGYLLPFIGALCGAVVGLWRRGKSAALVVWLVGLVLACGILALTQSKGAFLVAGATLVGVGFWRVWVHFRRLRPVIAAFAVVCLAAMAVACLAVDDWDEVGLRGGSIGVRLGFWKGALSIFLHHPLLGVGAGGFSDFYYAYKPDWAHEVRLAHSAALQTLAEFGVLGAGLVVAFVLSWLYEVRGRGDRGEVKEEGGQNDILVAGLSGPVALGVLSVVYQNESSLSLAAFVLIWCVSYGLIVRSLGEMEMHGGLGPVKVGLGIGLVALGVHSLVDIDLEVQGVAMTAAGIAGLFVQHGGGGGGRSGHRLSRGGRWFFLVGTGVGFLSFVLGVVMPIGTSERSLWRSKQAARRGLIKTAIGLAEESVRVDPSYTDGYATVAEFELLREGTEGERAEAARSAAAYLKRAIATDPQNSGLWRRLGEITARDFRYADDAVVSYKEALARYPSDPVSLRGLAELYEGLADRRPTRRREYLSEALTCYERFLRIAERATERRMQLPPNEKERMRRKVAQIKDLLEDE